MNRLPSISLYAVLVTASSCEAPQHGAEKFQEPIIASNIIASNITASNAITSNALTSNAIAGNALAGALLPPEQDGQTLGQVTQADVVTGLHDPDAQSLMKYVVNCALTPDQALRWTDRFS